MKNETIETAGAELANPCCDVERKPLVDALAFLNRIVERRNTFPILSAVAITIGDGAMIMTATDLDIMADVSVPCAGTVPGSFAVDAAALRDIVKKARSLLSLSVESEAGRLNVASGRNRYCLPLMALEIFPSLHGPGEASIRIDLPGDQLARDLAAVAPAMSKEEARYYLQGVAVQARAGRLFWIATDGHQLARIEREAPAGSEALPDIIIHRKTVASICQLLKGAEPATLSMETDGSRIAVDGPGWRVVAKLIDGSFIDWQSVMPGGEASPFGDVELQSVALVELEPRLNAGQIAALAKGVGSALSVETGEKAALLSARDYPEWLGMSMLLRPDAAPKGYGFSEYEHSSRHASGYLLDLAERRGLPKFADVTLRLTADGLVHGMTFGKAEWIQPPAVEVIDWNRIGAPDGVRTVQPEGHWEYEDGAYSVPMPRTHQSLVAVEIVGDDGKAEFHHLRTNKAGALELSKEAVRTLCGDVDQAGRVEIPALQFLHGEIVRGMHIPGPRWTIDGKRSRRMTDREQLDAYCADPAGFMAQLRARPADCDVGAAIQALAMLTEALPPARVIRVDFAGEAERRRVIEERQAAEEKAEAITFAGPLGAVIAGLVQRVEALEAERAPQAMEMVPVSVGSGITAESVSETAEISRSEGAPTVETPVSNRTPRSPARERLVRRYLTMRRQRQIDRAALEAAGEYVRQADAERDAMRVEMAKPTHLNGPAPALVARLHQERDSAERRAGSDAERIAQLERANARMGEEMERLAGRAIRAEQALQLYRTPALALTYQGDAQSVQAEGASQ